MQTKERNGDGSRKNIKTASDGASLRYDLERGLGEDDVAISESIHGNNSLTEIKGQGFFRKLIGEFSDPIIRILLVALAVTLVIPNSDGGSLDALGIAAAVLLATIVSTLCEYGSEKAFRKMQREASSHTCTVLRSGRAVEIAVSDVVVGDTVLLRSGDGIPADGILAEGTLCCDLSALNGESAEKRKTASPHLPDTSKKRELGDAHSLFRGGTVTSGGGKLLVLDVGDRTYYGKMASELQSDGGISPLKLKLTGLASTLSKFGYFGAAVVGVSNLLFNTVWNSSFTFSAISLASALLHSLTLAVSVVVMAVPEGLPMMITVVLSSNTLRMQREHVMVRKLVGIETAGSVNLLFTDKTGTLTTGKPEVTGYVGAYGKETRLRDVCAPIRELILLASNFAVACTFEDSGKGYRAVGGDVTDRAVMDAANATVPPYRGSNSYKDTLKGAERTEFFPFNSTDKLCAATVSFSSSSRLRSRYGERLTLIKGAPEIIIDRCTHLMTADGDVQTADRASLKATLSSLAIGGARVLAIAYSNTEVGEVARQAVASAEGNGTDISGMLPYATFVSFVCIRDEVRAEAAPSVKELTQAGIQTVMITGDNPLTAEAIAREVGILPPLTGAWGKLKYGRYSILLGSEIAAMSDAELAEIIPQLRVVARALPQDKSRLVRVSKSLGYVVAMTGDGLNDAPALKQADVGFAMGSGTEVSKEAGDIVITDDNIASIVSAVLYGRTIFRSIRKFIVFQLTMNLCAVGISVIAPFLGYETPLTVMQMLWINIIIDTLAALAFSGEAPLRCYMKERPMPRGEPVLSRDMMIKILFLGAYTLTLCIRFLVSTKTSEIFRQDEAVLLTGLFALFIFSGIIGGLNARTERLDLFSGLLVNPVFIAVMSGVFTVQVALIYYGGEIFDTVPLKLGELLYVIKLSLSVVVAGRLFEILRRVAQRTKRKTKPLSEGKHQLSFRKL